MLKRAKSRSLMIVFSCLAVLILLLSACGAPSGGGGNTGGNPVKGGTWTDDLFEDADSLIPNGSVETFADMIDQAIYTPLFVGDKDANINPALAKEVPTVANGDISSDFKTITIHLKSGLKWNDGQPLDARDVDFTWKTWVNPKFGAASTLGYNYIKSADLTDNNLTITFHLTQAYAPFVATLWVDGLVALLPMHHFASMPVESILKSPDNLNPSVTNGPFKMSESKPGDHYTLVRDPTYYQASQNLPYLDSVVFRIVPNQDTILKDLQAGTITSAWFLDVSKTVAYQRLSNYTLTSAPKLTNFEAMYFNFNNPILGHDAGVRKAMAMAIDHQSLIDVARRGEAQPLCTDHGSALKPGYQPDAPCPKFDPAAANTLLDSEGWAMGSDGYRHKGNEILDFNYSTTAGNLWRGDDELILQANFKKIGVKMEIQNYPASTFFDGFLTDGKASPATGAVSGRFDIAEFESSFGYDADDASVASCSQIPPNGFNIMFYCNHQLDSLYTQEESTAEPTARQAIFNQIHQIYLTDFPFVTLYSPLDIAMAKKGTHNYVPAAGGASETISLWTWWCTGGSC